MPVTGTPLAIGLAFQPEKTSPPGNEPVKRKSVKSLDAPVARRFDPKVVWVPAGGSSPLL